jgi:hypothetical protein
MKIHRGERNRKVERVAGVVNPIGSTAMELCDGDRKMME